MTSIEEVIILIDKLIQQQRGNSLSYIQKVVLKASLNQPKKNYAQIAHEYNYSEKYIKHLVAPQLWKLLSETIGAKINSTNISKQINDFLENKLSLNRQDILAENNSLRLESTAHLFSEKTQNKCTLEEPEGQVPLNSSLYINRGSLESTCYQKILEPGAFIRITAPRKMGKTSLMARILQYGTAQFYHTVHLDLNQVESQLFTSTDKFTRWFCTNIIYQLNLESDLDHYWDEELGALVSCTIAFQECILKKLDSPLILAVDEINQLFEYPKLTRDFLSLLRYWYEKSKDIKTWQNLRLIIVNSTNIYVYLKSNCSPFNIGCVIELPNFNDQEIINLIQCHKIKLTDLEIKKLIKLTGGFPYLVRLALYQIRRQNLSLDSLFSNATTNTGIYAKHLQEQLWQLKQNPYLFIAFLKVITATAPIQLDTEMAFKLKSLGLVHLQDNQARVSCDLYQEYFKTTISEPRPSLIKD